MTPPAGLDDGALHRAQCLASPVPPAVHHPTTWLGSCWQCCVAYEWPRVDGEWPWPKACPRCGEALKRLLDSQWDGRRHPLAMPPPVELPAPKAHPAKHRGEGRRCPRKSEQRLARGHGDAMVAAALANGPLTTRELGERLGLATATAYNAAERAEERGAIRRVYGRQGCATVWGLR